MSFLNFIPVGCFIGIINAGTVAKNRTDCGKSRTLQRGLMILTYDVPSVDELRIEH